MMRTGIEKYILRTLVYSDIFDYPLSKNELRKFSIGEKISQKSFEKELTRLLQSEATPLGCNRNFYYLLGREEIIKKRILREKESERKLKLAKHMIKILSSIPTIQFIGISGALALSNSNKDDDIDLFIITSKGSLWLTRFAMIILLLFTGRYRRRNQKQFSDKICLNMLIDESALSFPKERQDLYTAHEIVQMMPVFERNNMYDKCMDANKWIKKFLPNSIDTKVLGCKDIKKKERKSLNIFNTLAKKLQLWYIKKHMTTETVKDHFLAFHPFDYKKKILGEYKKRLKLYEV